MFNKITNAIVKGLLQMYEMDKLAYRILKRKK